MARILYDFECPSESCANKFEEFADWSNPVPVNCPLCGEPSKRLISAPRIDPRLGLDPTGFPTMGDKWAKVRRQRVQIENKQAASRGED